MDTDLDGVVAAVTKLSLVDGKAGRLIVWGHDIEALASDYDFADMAALLWYGVAPDRQDGAAIRQSLGQGRLRVAEMLPVLQSPLAGALANRGSARWLGHVQ